MVRSHHCRFVHPSRLACSTDCRMFLLDERSGRVGASRVAEALPRGPGDAATSKLIRLNLFRLHQLTWMRACRVPLCVVSSTRWRARFTPRLGPRPSTARATTRCASTPLFRLEFYFTFFTLVTSSHTCVFSLLGWHCCAELGAAQECQQHAAHERRYAISVLILSQLGRRSC